MSVRVLDRDELVRVLQGYVDGLLLAFNWDDPPQGEDYWLARYRGKKPLSDADKAYLQSLLDEHDKASKPDTANIKAEAQHIENMRDALEVLIEIGCDPDLPSDFAFRIGRTVECMQQSLEAMGKCDG